VRRESTWVTAIVLARLSLHAALLALTAGLPAADPAAPEAPDPAAIRTLIDEGRYADAERQARTLLQFAREGGEAGTIEETRAADLLVECLRLSGKAASDEAFELATLSAGGTERRFGAESPELAASLRNLALVHLARKEPAQARPLLERALAIQQRLPGPRSVEAALTLRALAGALEVEGRFTDARAFYEQALAIQEELPGPEALELAQTLNNFAVLLRTVGEFDRSLAQRVRCLEIRERALGHDHPQVAWALHNLANLVNEMGDGERARVLYEDALRIRRNVLPPDHPDLAYSYNSLGVLLHEQGEFPQARALLERGLEIRIRALGPEAPLVAASLTNLGRACHQLGDFAEARRLFERALAIKEASLGREHVDTAKTAENLALTLRELGDLAGARALHERVLATLRSQLGPAHHMIAWSLQNLGNVSWEQGDRAAARRLLEQGLAMFVETMGADHAYSVWVMRDLAALELELGNVAEASRLAGEAVTVSSRALGADHPELAAILAMRARALEAEGRPEAALADALRAETLARDQFARNARGLSQREALGFARARASGLDVAWSIVSRPRAAPSVAALAEVADAMVRSRALVLAEATRRRRWAGAFRTPEAARAAEALESAAAKLSHLLYSTPTSVDRAGYVERVHVARDERERAEIALARASDEFRRGLDERRVGLADVRAALPRDSALVSFVAFQTTAPEAGNERAEDRAYLALVVRSGAEPRLVRLGPAAPIEAAVADWKQQAGSASAARGAAAAEAYREAAGRLRRLVWDPLQPFASDVRRLLVVPDGALGIVSFATLPEDGDGSRFLVEDGPSFHYLVAERDVVQRARAPASPPGEGALIVGGPDYDLGRDATPLARSAGAGDCERLAALRFAALSGAALEAEEIAGLLTEDPRTTLTGAEASEEAFRRLAPGRRVLHLATHAFLLEDGACSAPGVESNPLLLSGLALAGANQRSAGGRDAQGDTDGILSADEIASLDLSTASFVVLSACETAAGRVQIREGVIGLRRAFETAGAASLVMSLWPVSDTATRAWMGRFYVALGRGLAIDDSVRAASLAILDERRSSGRSTHPFYWGAFLSSGAWDGAFAGSTSKAVSSSGAPLASRSRSE
jgi:tetratricopeptide (TPR) repeat protein